MGKLCGLQGDLFSAFIYNNLRMCRKGGYSAYMSPFVWMFIRTHERLRKHIIKKKPLYALSKWNTPHLGSYLCPLYLCTSKQQDKG